MEKKTQFGFRDGQEDVKGRNVLFFFFCKRKRIPGATSRSLSLLTDRKQKLTSKVLLFPLSAAAAGDAAVSHGAREQNKRVPLTC